MNLVINKETDLEREVSINMTEKELLALTVAIRDISPIYMKEAFSRDYGIQFTTDEACQLVYKLCKDMKKAVVFLGYNTNFEI